MTNRHAHPSTRRGAREYWARYRANKAAEALVSAEDQTDLWHPDDRIELTLLGRRVLEVLERRQRP